MKTDNVCPLCGERTVNGECPSCGYVVSDRDELDYMTHVMDLEPDNYPEMQPQEYEEDIYPPKYYEEQRRRELEKEREAQRMNVHADRFSQPPVQGNVGNYAQPNANNHNNNTGGSSWRSNINDTFAKILASRYRIPLMLAIALLMPKIAVLFFGILLKKFYDPRTEKLANIMIAAFIVRFILFWWIPW